MTRYKDVDDIVRRKSDVYSYLEEQIHDDVNRFYEWDVDFKKDYNKKHKDKKKKSKYKKYEDECE